MSGDQHPDLELFYDSVDNGEGDDALWGDDPEDGDYEYYLDDDGIDEEDMEGEDDDDDFIDEDEDEENMETADLLADRSNAASGEDVRPAATLSDIVEALNQSGDSGNPEGRDAFFAQLLGQSAQGTRAGVGGLLSRLRAGVNSSREGDRTRAPPNRVRARWWTPQKEPHPRGLELLQSGEFGRVGDRRVPGKPRRARGYPMERTRRGAAPRMVQATIPNTNGTVVASYPSIPYVGQYAGEDYSVFYAATQYFTLHLYATNQARPSPRKPRRQTASSPGGEEDMDIDMEMENETRQIPGFGGPRRMQGAPEEDTSMKKIKNVQGVEGRWTVTDCDADRKGERMIYSSITPYVHMLNTTEDDTEHVELDFSGIRRRHSDMWAYDSFGIWSIRFSADGKEVVAGAGSGKIMVYDIDAQRRTLSVGGHADDVNAVCFADESSTNILVSGSDDGYVKVWDRRSLSSSTPSGVLVGATEGITYTAPKGDGRYIVVNSKDQAARLYDLRKMRSWGEFDGEPDAVSKYGQPRYDYRNARYPEPRLHEHPKDCSVMTFRGHSVLRTLIRCHFSPRESTGQSYIYSGSADGMIHIWSLDGRVVQVLNRAESVPLRTVQGGYNDPSAVEPQRGSHRYGAQVYEPTGINYTTRDVAWHGYEPTLMSTCWEVDSGYRRGGTLAKHEWKGLGKGGLRRLEDWVEKAQAEGECGGIEV